MTDVIQLDSDEEMDESKNAGASIDIVNAVPLDLTSIFGGGPIVASKPNGHSPAVVAARSQPYQRPLTATVRLAHNRSSGGGVVPQRYANHPTNTTPTIRSSTSVTHTTSYQPLPRPPPAAFQQQHTPQPIRGVPTRNGLQNGSMNAIRTSSGGVAGAAAGELMKMRLQMAQNGSYKRVPPREAVSLKPVPVVMAEEVSLERLKNYAFDAERAGVPVRGVPDGVMNSQRFRCTYTNGTTVQCNALIYGNVNFMNHVWSHVAVWKPTDDDVEKVRWRHGLRRSTTDGYTRKQQGKTDVDALSTCSQCMARFEYPFQMQIHYTRAHSRLKQAVVGNTCAICEKEVGDERSVTSLKHHLAIHHSRDAPYRCPCCTYKCNIRLHLYDHFCRRHAHHTTLMCPFCSYFKTVEVPQTKHKKRFHIIKCREFVMHMKKHESVADKKDINRSNPEVGSLVAFNAMEAATNKRRIACDKCAQCFTKTEDRIIHINQMHVPLNVNYEVRARAMETRNRRPSELVLLSTGKYTMCDECKKKQPQDRNRKCAACARVIFSLDAMAAKNIAYSDNVIRPDVRALATAPVEKGKCQCRFESSSANLLAAHFIACRRRIRVALKEEEEGKEKKKEEPMEQTSEEQKREKEELALFAVQTEQTPADFEKVQATIESLQQELADAVVARIKERDAPPVPTVNKRQPKTYVPIKDPDAMDQLEERLHSIAITQEAMKFRCRIERNDMAKSEKQFKEIMARREEEE
ncbi:hypothetical protein PMAYCL1PPCAC_21893 [Pristionchus mayeri]|uniref:C2H2-type domain-containing protein n=1 Tax=Pristionchus mayeri TaxID=1317129 RepID=A0AAN5CVQ8_9BILA|nr:hypothetical protein PMAYCL1PPCAC_21893 [Pristionchus mayeri]